MLHALAGVLITAAWVLTTALLYVAAEVDVLKTARISIGPLFVVFGMFGLTGCLDLLHRTQARTALHWVSLTTSALTSAVSCAVLFVVTGAVPAVRSPLPPSEVLFLTIIAVGGPLLLVVVGGLIVRRTASRRVLARSGGDPDETTVG